MHDIEKQQKFFIYLKQLKYLSVKCYIIIYIMFNHLFCIMMTIRWVKWCKFKCWQHHEQYYLIEITLTHWGQNKMTTILLFKCFLKINVHSRNCVFFCLSCGALSAPNAQMPSSVEKFCCCDQWIISKGKTRILRKVLFFLKMQWQITGSSKKKFVVIKTKQAFVFKLMFTSNIMISCTTKWSNYGINDALMDLFPLEVLDKKHVIEKLKAI